MQFSDPLQSDEDDLGEGFDYRVHENGEDEKASTIKGLPLRDLVKLTSVGSASNATLKSESDDLFWERDLILPTESALSWSNQLLQRQSSFSSHISDDVSDDNSKASAGVNHNRPLPRASRTALRGAHSSTSSLASHSEDNEEDNLENVFDLASSFSKFSVSAFSTRSASPKAVAPPMLISSSQASHRRRPSSLATSFSDLESSDADTALFDGLLLPAYFTAHDPGKKPNLQKVLVDKAQKRIEVATRALPQHPDDDSSVKTWEQDLVIAADHDWSGDRVALHNSAGTFPRS